MNITNNHNLHYALLSVLTKDPYVKVGDFSTTELIAAPQRVILQKRYDDLLTIDASDLIYAQRGHAMHKLMESATLKKGDWQEKRLTMTINGKVISGTVDLYVDGGTVVDWKETSTHALNRGTKPEWIAQVNIYAELVRQAGYPVNKGEIWILFRDHMKRKAQMDYTYPEIVYKLIDIPLWTPRDTMQYIKDRITAHTINNILPDHELMPCTDAEMWSKPIEYKVRKGTNKRSSKNATTMEEAEKYMSKHKDKAKMKIETWPGERVRCENSSYCLVRDFCHQYKIYKEAVR